MNHAWSVLQWLLWAVAGFIIGATSSAFAPILIAAACALLLFVPGLHIKLLAIGMLLALLPILAFIPAGFSLFAPMVNANPK